MIYLAAPYSDPNPNIVELRMFHVHKQAALLFQRGLLVYSPLSHFHEMAKIAGLKTDAKTFATHNIRMLALCHTLYIITLPGWQDSIGVQAELKQAQELKLDVVYIPI